MLSECVHVQSWEGGVFCCSIFQSQVKLHQISLFGREVFQRDNDIIACHHLGAVYIDGQSPKHSEPNFFFLKEMET